MMQSTTQNQSFAGQSLNGCRYEETTFKKCDFREANLRSASFVQVTFENCNFSLTKIEGCRFQNVTFLECKLAGLGFHQADPRFFSIQAIRSVLMGCNFADCKMQRNSFKESKVIECHFTNTKLAQTDFTHCDLQGTLFHNCDLSKADFRHSRNYHIDPRTNKIAQARFTYPEVTSLLDSFNILIE